VKKRFLITTALEETWLDREPALFLGEWCRRYSRRDRWSKMDAEVLSYHWDDRARLYSDVRYLEDLYERLLWELTDQLNKIHGVGWSARYWRILIGPWLGHFVQMLFDRWTCLQRAREEYQLSGAIVLAGTGAEWIPNDMADFTRLFLGDEWNQHIYALIMREFIVIPCKVREGAPVRASVAAVCAAAETPGAFATLGERVAGAFVRDRDAFLKATYLPRVDELRLHLRMRQAPQYWRSPPPERIAPAEEWRSWVVAGEVRSPFESCARALIPRQLPTAYLEGYRRLREGAMRLPWPKSPKLIWTSNSHFTDDLFKAWTAEKVESGTPLVIGQHGGHNGMGLWSFIESHEVRISSRYLSWGWDQPEEPKIIPLGQLKAKRPMGVRHADQPRALLVTVTHPRYSYCLYSSPVAGQWLDYFQDQFAFVEALPPPIRDALTVRLYSQDLGWDQAERWRDRFPLLTLDSGKSDINELIGSSRLYISTYNATTFLEGFSADVPTVIYWDRRLWELRDSAAPYFDELRRVGIFHDTPESAARHVAAVWDDVGAWWSAPDLRSALERFKARFCRLPDDLLGRVEHALVEASSAPDAAGAP
jgi:putative transferase (TIGR04331 family)